MCWSFKFLQLDFLSGNFNLQIDKFVQASEDDPIAGECGVVGMTCRLGVEMYKNIRILHCRSL